MAVTQYKDISWADNEPLDTNKLNTMVSNSRYLFERAAKLYYNAYGTNKDTGIKIACGAATIPPTTGNGISVNTYFGSFFTPGCQPVITVSITSSYNRRVIPTIYGLSGASSIPDHRGFVGVIAANELTAASNHIYKTMHLNWIAMGY